MGKILIFFILYRLTGNPIIAFLVLLGVYLVLDRAYFGFLPDPVKVFESASRIRKLKKAVSINPHDGRSLKELGICMVEREEYKDALRYFEMAESKMSEDAEFNYYYGLCTARASNIDKGRELIENAVTASPSLKYGEPYLAMAELYIDNADYKSALPFLEKFLKIHTSSSRGFYRIAVVKLKLGLKDEGVEYLKKSIKAFKESPFFKRKKDRKWAWKARMLLITSGN